MVEIAKAYAEEMSLLKHFKGQLALRYLTIRYEDIAQTTDQSLERVAAFLGLPVDLVPSSKNFRISSRRR